MSIFQIISVLNESNYAKAKFALQDLSKLDLIRLQIHYKMTNSFLCTKTKKELREDILKKVARKEELKKFIYED